MAETIRTQEATLKRRNTVKLPQLFIEEGIQSKDTVLNVHYGRNHTCVIIVPKDLKLSDNAKSRISILVNEPLT